MSNQQTLTPLPGQFSRGVANTPPPNQQHEPKPPTQQDIENIQFTGWLQDRTTQRVLNSLEHLQIKQLKQAGLLALKAGVTQEELRVVLMKAAILGTILDRIVKQDFTNLL